MPLLSREALVWIRLNRRYKLDETVPNQEPAGVSKLIIPVTDADKLKRTSDIVAATLASDIVSPVKFHTAPAGKIWSVHAIYALRSTGDRNIAAVLVYEEAGTFLNIASAIAASTYTSGMLSKPVELRPGWAIALEFTGGATDGNFVVKILYDEEDSFY